MLKSKTVLKYTAYTENWVYLPQTDAIQEKTFITYNSIKGKKYTLAHMKVDLLARKGVD